MSKITPERRSEIAKAAAAARWKKPISQKQENGAARKINVDDFSRTLARSFQLPKEYYDKPSLAPAMDIDILEIAAARARYIIQLGAEVGLQPAQSIASIVIRYGNPLMKGDAQLALVLSSGKAEYVNEYADGTMYGEDGQLNLSYSAVCETKRFGLESPIISRFSVEDAITAELWGKSGTWQTHKPRMMKYKARAFSLRDAYPDVLKGLCNSVEEMEGVTMARGGAGDIAPADPTKKLSGILKGRMLHNTITDKKGD